MLSKLLADLVILLHLVFILFVVFGALLVLYRRWIAWLHIPMVLWSSIVNLTPWFCPLTPLENFFRMAAGEEGYSGGFVRHYIAPLIYPQGLTYDLAVVVGVFVFAWNLLLYGLIVYRLRHGKKSASPE